MESNLEMSSADYEETKRIYSQMIEANKDWLQKGYFCSADQIKTKIKDLILNPKSDENMVAGLKDGKLRLYKKVSPTVLMEILTVEDAFDTILRAHLQCMHGDVTTTQGVLSNQYSVAKFCVDAVIDSCSVCAKTAFELGRGVWRMNIIKDEKRLPFFTPNDKVKYVLLILKEDATNFIILRALYPALKEIALELMRIFVEFNYPKQIVVADQLELHTQTLRLVHAINPVPEMPEILLSHNKEVFEADKTEVLNELEDWATMENDTHWDHYCPLVQYKMNTQKKDLTRLDPEVKANGVPFKLFFKYQPKFKLEWMPKPAENAEN